MEKSSRKSISIVIIISVMLTLGSVTVAQDTPPDPPVDIPFIDRDGDGINDLLQHGWGLRFLNRYKKRQLVWEQLNVEIIRGDDGPMVDTDGDGVGDMSIHDFMKEKMDEMIDTDGDGVPDTALKDYLGRRFRGLDANGDGIPDEISREQLRAHMEQMRQWRQEIRERLRQGLPAFIDENGDGIPDNLPPGFGWRMRNRGGK